MTVREWKTEMAELVKDFQFHAESGDIEKLREMLREAERIAEGAKRLVEGI
jgi:hypothetical protein